MARAVVCVLGRLEGGKDGGGVMSLARKIGILLKDLKSRAKQARRRREKTVPAAGPTLVANWSTFIGS